MARKAIFRGPAGGESRALRVPELPVLGPPRATLSALLFGCLLAGPAMAQMQLPGALGGKPDGTPPSETGAPPIPAAPPKPVIIKPPSEDTIVGVTLKHDGTKGQMTFERTGSDLSLTKLTLAGDKISSGNQTCSVDVTLSPPIVARPVGRPVGANRFDVQVPVCPFVIDVLDGAVLVSPTQPKCEITAADCRVAPTGLWGPPAGEIPPERTKAMEHDRVRLETTMRTNFRALLRKAGKDRAAVKAIAADQAAFSSDREVTCRDYDQESAVGFCSTQITQARTLALIAKFGDTGDVPEKKTRPKKPKSQPAAPSTTAPPPPPAAAAEGQ